MKYINNRRLIAQEWRRWNGSRPGALLFLCLCCCSLAVGHSRAAATTASADGTVRLWSLAQ